MRDLTSAVALVTGAGGGIGRATALALAARGARVVVHYHKNEAGAGETVNGCHDLEVDAFTAGGDLADARQVATIVSAIEERWGQIDILVNNAGDLIGRSPLTEMSEGTWRRVLDVNLTSAFLCTQAVVPGMVRRRSGAIVNVSSLAAHNGGGPGSFAYATAKGGLLSFTRATAKELARHGIRVNAVAPGLIGDTGFHARFTSAEAFADTARAVPLGRAGTPDEVAEVVAFLCTSASSYLCGETIEINGGLYLR